MPEIDTDQFQLLSLVLLGLGVLIGLAILAALGRLRKSLEKAVAERNRQPAAAESPQYFEPPAGGLTAAAAEMPDSADAEPEPQAESATPDEEPAAAAGVVSAELAPEPEVARATPEPVEEAPARAEPEPAAWAAPAETSGATGADEAAAATQAEEPEEQPFERGGRWWFRRGDELLVYDDASGQWQQAPPEAAPSSTTRQGVPTTFGDVVRAETDTAEISVEEEAEQGGSFWKCPACGAVNGSTATSCRMCFAARP